MDTLAAANCIAAGSLREPGGFDRNRRGAEDEYYRLHDQNPRRAFGLISLAATLLALALTLESQQH